MRSVSIVIADDHPVVLSGLVMLLKADKTFRLVAACVNGTEALNAIRSLKPDLALLDINMPGLNGLQVLKAVTENNVATRVFFLTALPSDREIVAAIAGGAYGVLLKESAPDTLIGCLHLAASGQKWLSGDLIDGALERTREHSAQVSRIEDLLTPREIEVMLSVAEGISNKQVGSRLSISEGTVKIHLNNIYQKVGVSNRTSLASFAIAYRDKAIAIK